MVLYHAKLKAGVSFNILLQIFRKLLITLSGNDGQGVDFKAPQTLPFLVDAEP